MGRAKRGSGMLGYFNPGLFGAGGQFSNNPSANRERQIHFVMERNISELAVNRFKWSGLPKEISPRFLELTLLTNGMCVFYKDHDFDKLIAVKASSTGFVNFNDEPTSFTVIGPGSKNVGGDGNLSFSPKTLSAYIPSAHYDLPEEERAKKGVAIYPNYFRFPEIDIIRVYATRLATTDHTLEINTRNARQNKYAVTTQNTQLSTANLIRQIDEGVNSIQASGGMNPAEVVSVIDLGINPDLFDKLSILRTRWWNECMGLLGIDNANQDKKERLVAAEVGANDSQTDSMRFVSLNARREACERINDVFGTNISVDFNVEVEAMEKAMRAVTLGPDTDKESAKTDDEKGAE